MKIKYTSIVLAIIIITLIVSFTVSGCKNTINARTAPAATTKAPATTAAPTTTQAK